LKESGIAEDMFVTVLAPWLVSISMQCSANE